MSQAKSSHRDRPVGEVVVVGGNRIPFARSNRHYANASNQDMLTAVLNGLTERFALAARPIGEVVAGAVLKHSRDFNLTRESVLGSRLSSAVPAVDMQQACGTGLQAVIAVANKIALGQLDSGIAGGVDTTSDAPIGLNEELRRLLLDFNRSSGIAGRMRSLARFRPGHVIPEIPKNAEPRTGLSMGEHAARTAAHWQIARAESDELTVTSHRRLAAAYDRGFFDDLVTPYRGLERDANLRVDTDVERLAGLPVVFGPADTGIMTAANSSPLTDGAATVLLASPQWAIQQGLPTLARFVDAQTGAVDFVDGPDGLLTAPVHVVPRLLARHGLTLADFDFVEIHEAFASQVLATLRAWRDPEFCKRRLGLGTALGEVNPARLNVVGSSLATGHPFAATGARIVATVAKLLAERGGGRALISICAAGGQGVAAILER